MIEILGHDLGFWMGLIAGLFILLHIPSCNKHWADRLKPFSLFLRKYHDLTLVLATLFALGHIALAFVGLGILCGPTYPGCLRLTLPFANRRGGGGRLGRHLMHGAVAPLGLVSTEAPQ